MRARQDASRAVRSAKQSAVRLGVRLPSTMDQPMTSFPFGDRSQTVYLRDPGGKGVELYLDMPQEQWPRDTEEGFVFSNHRFSVDDYIAETDAL